MKNCPCVWLVWHRFLVKKSQRTVIRGLRLLGIWPGGFNDYFCCSIIIDDFDSSKDPKDQKTVQNSTNSTGTTPRVYTRSYSDASIKKILEEAEHRKHEFWKLLDEHNAVIENLKRIENLEHKII
ncbi:hypothetical protein HUJ05_012305 [Dendroctonus ponderosae]|nr:hypothetical protein HUJ05_012305 [Dendroctonus ponderosae]